MEDTIKFILITLWLISCNFLGLGLYSYIWSLDCKKSKKNLN